jgi:gas vesicle protein
MKEGIIPSIYRSFSTIIDGFATIVVDPDVKAKYDTLMVDITAVQLGITNKLADGDTLFGTGSTAGTLQVMSGGTNNVTAFVKQRQNEIQTKVKDLKKEIDRKYQIIQTHDRDFADYLDKGEKTNESKLLSVEDYTLFVFLISYLFMACMFIYTYTYMAEPIAMTQQFAKALGLTTLVTIIGAMIFYSAV